MIHAKNNDDDAALARALNRKARGQHLQSVPKAPSAGVGDAAAPDVNVRQMQWDDAADQLRILNQLMNGATGLYERLMRLERGLEAAHARIAAFDKGDVVFVEARLIGRFYAADKYTGFTIDGKEYLTSESLRSLEARLEGLSFMRTHRSELVNIARVSRLRGIDGTTKLILVDGQEARVSRQLEASVRHRLLSP